MSSGPSFHNRRASALFALVAVTAGVACCQSAAQSRGASRTLAPPAPVRQFPKPLSSTPLGELPLQRNSKEDALNWMRRASQAAFGGSVGISAPAPPATQSQFIDLTTNPRPPQVGTSTLAQEIHPMWGWDQQSIFFASNNVNPVAEYGTTAPPGNATYHIYRMSSDGAFIAQMTGTTVQGEATGNQLYPAINHSLTKLAYVHRNSPADPFQLYILDLFTGAREQLTGISVNNSPVDSAALVSVQRPSWAPGDGLITFAARNGNIANDPLNIYVVDTVSKVVRRLTSATAASGVECKDPMFHPNPNAIRVTFSANTGNPTLGTATNAATGDLVYRANPLQDLRGDGSANDVDHNLFSTPLNGPSAGNPITQLTTAIADDVEPSYNQSVYPPGSNPTAGAFNNYLAFSSMGRQGGNTYDIYFSNGNQEDAAANPPIRLFTPDTNAGAVPLNGSDERYPTWSSSLPPQNPIDRIAFSSNRQNNPNDLARPTVSATDTDIWTSEVTDITPPTLFWLDEQAGEVMHIANAPLPNPGRRVGAPGDRFYFYARVKDLQYGVESVWAQIKDPDGPGTDSQGQNHKLYGAGRFPSNTLNLEGNNIYTARWINSPLVSSHYIHVPWETDSEGIGVSDYQYYSSPRRFDWGSIQGLHSGSNAQFASLSPGVDDSIRWSGNGVSPYWQAGPGSPYTGLTPMSHRPPVDVNGNNRWLRLRDDGNFPDQVAGDDVYSASWDTPADASDFYVDLICYDKAFNPQDPNEQQNWIIYDNIWGFSTQRFISTNPVLYVDDNGAGQKWPRGLKGSFRPFRVFRYGTESDICERESSFYPREVRPTVLMDGTRVAPYTLADIRNAGGGGPGTNQVYDFLPGGTLGSDFISWGIRGSLRAYRYDNWRILAKGPVTETVLNNYTPVRDEQPLDLTGTDTIQRPVPRRAVVWNAPYTGDIFAGVGSILDQATQDLLATYQSRAGRLMVAGGDIMWALTGGDPQNQHQFHQNVLGADFVSDEGGNGADPNFAAFQNGPRGQDMTLDAAGRNFQSPYSGAPPWWAPGDWDPDPLGTSTSWPDSNTNGRQGAGNVPWTGSTDGTPFATQDNLAARTGWETVYANRMVVRHDAATDSKTVFLSASLASVGRRYGAENDDAPLDCLNYRAKIAHAMFCWMFSADLVGQVRNLNGNAPVSGAWVRAFQGGALVGSAFSRADGTYAIRGLPVGGWAITVTNPGFLGFNKATSSAAHGLDQAQLDVLLSPANPGSISGQAVDQANQPVPGAMVHATLRASVLYTGIRDFFATTGADGTYIIPSAPVGTYDVTLDTPLPAGFSSFTPQFTPPVTVNQSQATTGINFQLQGGAGDLTINVFRQLPDGTKGAPLSDADVSLLDANGALIAGMTAVTDVNGSVTFTAVPAGPTTISAFKSGFQENSRVVSVPQQQTPVEILLAVATPQFVYGRATRAIDNAELSTPDLNPPVSLQLLRSVSQLPIGSTTDVFSPAQLTPQRHNYAFNTFEGSYSVALRNHPRFQDASVNVVVTAAAPSFAPVLQLIGKRGTLSGTVRENNGGAPGAPIAGVNVQIISQVNLPGTTVETVITGADGRWVTTVPYDSDLFTVQISKFGYSSLTLIDQFLAGDTDLGTSLLVKAPRGQLYGLTRRTVDGVARPDVKVEFWTPAGSSFGAFKVAEVTSSQTTSAAPDGGLLNYTIGGTAGSAEFLPEGTYQVRVTGDPRFASFSGSATVTGAAATRFNVDLTPLGGVLTGLVKEDIDTGPGVVPGPPVAGATVRILAGASVVATLTTDANGQYQTTAAIPPTSYTVTATAFGFRSGSATVFVEGPTSPPATPDVLLEREPPSTVSGAITSRLNGSYIADATVDLLPANGSTTPVVSGLTSGTATGSPPANYQLTNVPAGAYILRATKPGWKTAQTASFTVNPGIDRLGINLQLDPQYTFGQGLLLVSLPDDFPGQDAAGVLGISPSTFRSAYWNPSQGSYSYYHLNQPEAKEFRLGKSMFVRFNSPTAFVRAGAPAPNVPFSIPVQAGWNMIGSVRRQRIEWLRVKVSTSDGQVRTMQQAMDSGVVGNGLFNFVDQYFRSDNMDPFVGYFMKANQDCTLIVPVNNASASVTPAERKRVARIPAPSLAQVAAEIEAAGLAPAASAGAQYGSVPAWAALAAPASRPSTLVRPIGPQSTNNQFELWPWRPGLG